MGVSTLLYGNDNLTEGQEKGRQALVYLLAGIVSTIVNAASFVIFDKIVTKSVYVTIIKWSFDAMLFLNQGLSWLLSMIASYIMIRLFVFRSNGHVVKELFQFVSTRFLTFLVVSEALFMLVVMFTEHFVGMSRDTVLIEVLGLNLTVLYLLKALNGLVAAGINYMLSFFVVFKEKKND